MGKKVTAGKRSVDNKKMLELLAQLTDSNISMSDQLSRNIASLQGEMNEIKSMLSRLKPPSPKRPPRRRGLFGRRPMPVPIEVETSGPKGKNSIPLEELLPLLPQLGSFIPQLNTPKMQDTVKILSNPAVIGMIQQFINKGGLKGANLLPVKGNVRR
ncbi:hypothetical protein [Brevibacillus dissolubilis]|uniref:hypothetical protein n=1 Tax=Brevibacillus dissolubilis TaxID=1844116 RepID=UPI0011168153|nr:hypothetical protein [Brevibacillus dissolubilis]